MKNLRFFLLLLVAGIFFSCKSKRDQPYSGEKTMAEADTSARIHFPGEKHLRNIHQLTFGGDNAEAYWSFSGNKIVFQRADHTQYRCDQIFTGSVEDYLRRTNETEFLMKQDSGGMAFQLSSTGKGRTTCAAFLPGDSTILFASTHLAADSCPPVPDRKKIGRYVWPIYDSYEIFVADLNGNILRQLTNNNHYDAEATLSPKGDRIIFTSTRDGDLELYTMNLDGSNVSRITHEQGYDGGAWFSPDGSQIIWRASRPEVQEEKNDYRRLLKQQLVAPNKMDVWVANADGSDAKKITEMKGANWAPVFTPDGKQILFASNSKYDRGFPFDLYLINLDGTGLEQVTFSQSFDAFPMFSYDGKYLIWCSNRNNGGGRDTNIFIAEWVP